MIKSTTNFDAKLASSLDDLFADMILDDPTPPEVYQLPQSQSVENSFKEFFAFAQSAPKTPNNYKFLYEAAKDPDCCPRTFLDLLNTRDVNEVEPNTGNRALHYLVMTQRYDLMCFLLHSTCSTPPLINVHNLDGLTPMHLACQTAFNLGIELLLNGTEFLCANFKPTLPSNGALSPLHLLVIAAKDGAALEDIKDCLELFKKHSVYPHTKNYAGQTPMEMARALKDNGNTGIIPALAALEDYENAATTGFGLTSRSLFYMANVPVREGTKQLPNELQSTLRTMKLQKFS